MPVGPVNMGLISATIRAGGRYGIMMGLGASLMDFVYMIAALSGVSLMSFDQGVVMGIKIFGGLILFVLGIKELVSTVPDPNEKQPEEKIFRKRRFFLMGILFYATNPGILVFFTGIAVYLRTLEFLSFHYQANLLTSLGVSLGSTFWFLALMIFVKKIKGFLDHKRLTVITRISGVGLLLLSVAVFIDLLGYSFT